MGLPCQSSASTIAGVGSIPGQRTKIPTCHMAKKKKFKKEKKKFFLIKYYEKTYTTKTGFTVLQRGGIH